MKVGFAKDGRVTAVDLFAVMDNGPYEQQFDVSATGLIVSLLYQPPAMHWRGMTVLTNTPPRRPQSQPGGMQGITLMERLVNKAAHKLGLDQVEIRRRNAPEGKAPLGPLDPKAARHAFDELLRQASVGSWRVDLRVGSPIECKRAADRDEGSWRRRVDERVLRRIERVRWAPRREA
jgi:CO/xanthine dehydrogenase Mo-binding subunit